VVKPSRGDVADALYAADRAVRHWGMRWRLIRGRRAGGIVALPEKQCRAASRLHVAHQHDFQVNLGGLGDHLDYRGIFEAKLLFRLLHLLNRMACRCRAQVGE
jgi:hypothetical protein